MVRNWVAVFLILILFFGGFSSVTASTPPAKIITGILSNVVSALVKRLWSLKSPAKPAASSGSKIKFEGGYTVETVFDGSKLGIEPYSVDVSPSGEILVLDSENSNIYRVSTPLSQYSRPKLVAGSAEGYYGHIDGRPREARMNHPRGLTVDDRGNIYVADTMNMAIRKISDTGVTTIAGAKWGHGGGHVDGPSEDAQFSNEFDLVYVGSSCSLLVIDRGNQAIREIQLHDEDCSEHSDANLYIDIAGISVLVAAVFFGYILAVLQRKVQAMFSSNDDPRTPVMKRAPQPLPPYQRPPRSTRPPLIPPEDDIGKPEEGFFGSIGKLVTNTGSSVTDLFGGLFSGFRRKPVPYQLHPQYQQRSINTWPMQESFVIPDDDEPPPSLETRGPTPKRANPYTSKDLEKKQHIKQSRAYYHNGWEVDYHRQQQQQQQQHMMQNHHLQQQQHHHMQFSANPQTYYEKSCETNEIVFGAVQEQDGRHEAMVIKAVDYGDPAYSHQNIRPRPNYMNYSHGY